MWHIIKNIDVDNNELIFKYYSWDTYSKESFEQRYFWFSKPTNFNDPFDSNMVLLKAFEKSNEIFEQRFDENITLYDYIKDSTDNFGVLCFTKETEVGKIGDKGFNNLHFWSHYADSHKGLSIGFDKELVEHYYSDKLRCKASLSMVNYLKMPINIDNYDFIRNKEDNYTITQRISRIFGAYRDEKNIDAFFQQVLLFKDARIWSNENEFRIVLAGRALNGLKESNPFTSVDFDVFDKNGYRLPYPEGNIIKEVTFGVNFKKEEISNAISLISKNNSQVLYYKAVIDFTNADIIRTEIK